MKSWVNQAAVCALALGLSMTSINPMVWAHQPVMDMAPRWEDGSGAQVRHEWRSSDTLKDGDSEIDNPLGRRRRVDTTWIEGIYTVKRELRFSFKLPWVDQSRVVVRNGVPIQQADSGWGDLILGMPLKYYRNLKSSSWNVAFTPSIRVPTGSTSADFPVGDGSTDSTSASPTAGRQRACTSITICSTG